MATAAELREQIKEWQKQRDNIEDMIEEAYMRLDELEGDNLEELIA